MPDDTPNLPAARSNNNLAFDVGDGLPPSLRLLLDANAYERVKAMAGMMSRAEGITPRHLIGKPEACHAVINISLDAKLSPHFVARHTYQTPGGQIGYDGALVQSVLEQSGRFVGSPEFEYRGDWTVLTGKFEKVRGTSGGEYIKPTWTAQDAIGLGVIVRWLVRGEKTPRVWPGEDDPFWLTQCFPLNSPLWANDPKTQIAYLAIRRFANQTSPGILGAAGAPIVDDDDAREMIDVTPPPRPQREAVEDAEEAAQRKAEAEKNFVDGMAEGAKLPQFWGIDRDHNEIGFATIEQAAEWLLLQIAEAKDDRSLDQVRDDNQQLIDKCYGRRKGRISQALAAARSELQRDHKFADRVATQQNSGGAKGGSSEPQPRISEGGEAQGASGAAPPADTAQDAARPTESGRMVGDGQPASPEVEPSGHRTIPRHPGPSPSGDGEPPRISSPEPERPQAAAIPQAARDVPTVPVAAKPGGAFQPRKIEVGMRAGQPDYRGWLVLFNGLAGQCQNLDQMVDLTHLNETEIAGYRAHFNDKAEENRRIFEAALAKHWGRVTAE